MEPGSPGMREQWRGHEPARPSCCSLAKDSPRLAAAEGDAAEAPEAEYAVQEPELARALPAEQCKPPAPACEASNLTDSGWHGDSAYLGEEEACQWVSSKA